jgi:tetratricopeptide (TPR) repeat protein
LADALAARAPENADWQSHLAFVLARKGDFLLAAEDNAAAAKMLEKSLAISSALAARDPGNVDQARNLAMMHHKLGDASQAGGEAARAAAAHGEAIAILARLAEQEPEQFNRDRDLALGYVRVGDAEAHALIQQMDEAGLLADEQRDLRATMRSLLLSGSLQAMAQGLETSAQTDGQAESEMARRAHGLIDTLATIEGLEQLVGLTPEETVNLADWRAWIEDEISRLPWWHVWAPERPASLVGEPSFSAISHG